MSFVRISSPSIEDDEENPFGHRIPSKPLTGKIDFDSNEIYIYGQIEEIENFEIWDEGYTTMIYSDNDESGFIQVLSEYGEPVTIVLHTTSFTYIGSFNPSPA